MQSESINFEETFSPIARFDSIKTVLTIAAHHKWSVFWFNVKSAFKMVF